MSDTTYRISRGGKVQGEYGAVELAQLIKRGSVKHTDYYSTKGMKGWKYVSEIAPSLLAMLDSGATSPEAGQGPEATDRVFHFARDGKEYARFPESKLRAAWPAEIQTTDTYWILGQDEWLPAWKLQNQLGGQSPSGAPAKSASAGKPNARPLPPVVSYAPTLAARKAEDAMRRAYVIGFLVVAVFCVWLFANATKSGEIPKHVTAEWAGRTAAEVARNENVRKAVSSPPTLTAFARAVILDQLKAPATANFSGESIQTLSSSEDGTVFKVTGYVDSQNGFGAYLRGRWYVKIRLKDNQLSDIGSEISN